MSDFQGMCFLIIDNAVSVGINTWGVCVYSIFRGLIVLMGCISKSGCFSDNHCKVVCTGVNACDCEVKSEYFFVIKLDL